jgi:hypothetical protein
MFRKRNNRDIGRNNSLAGAASAVMCPLLIEGKHQQSAMAAYRVIKSEAL